MVECSISLGRLQSLLGGRSAGRGGGRVGRGGRRRQQALVGVDHPVRVVDKVVDVVDTTGGGGHGAEELGGSGEAIGLHGSSELRILEGSIVLIPSVSEDGVVPVDGGIEVEEGDGVGTLHGHNAEASGGGGRGGVEGGQHGQAPVLLVIKVVEDGKGDVIGGGEDGGGADLIRAVEGTDVEAIIGGVGVGDVGGEGVEASGNGAIVEGEGNQHVVGNLGDDTGPRERAAIEVVNVAELGSGVAGKSGTVGGSKVGELDDTSRVGGASDEPCGIVGQGHDGGAVGGIVGGDVGNEGQGDGEDVGKGGIRG